MADQHICYYGIAKKTRKWWKHIYVTLCLVDMVILNAHVIFRCNTHCSSVGEAAVDFMRDLRRHCLQRISVAVQRGNAAAVLGTMGRRLDGWE